MSEHGQIAPNGHKRFVRPSGGGQINNSVDEGPPRGGRSPGAQAGPRPGQGGGGRHHANSRRDAAMRGDPFNLTRFESAQTGVFKAAIEELSAGRKRTHWMWFVFPQLKALGRSPAATLYGLSAMNEAAAYAQHPILGPRLRAATIAVLASPATSLQALFGSPDDLKFRSSMTLFSLVDPEGPYQAALDRWCGGQVDDQTIALLRQAGHP